MLSNQFFFTSLLILPAISQYYRVAMERRDFEHRHQLKEYLGQVRILATKDPLTGLNNRRHLFALGERDLKRCERNKKSLTVIIADIDHFKNYNDTYSHTVGDEVIRGVGAILSKCVREIDVVGRYGGEEFLIVLPEADARQAEAIIAKRIRKLFQNGIATSAGALPVTLSFGICAKDRDAIPLTTLIERADAALYEAKNSGRNCAIIWEAQKAA